MRGKVGVADVMSLEGAFQIPEHYRHDAYNAHCKCVSDSLSSTPRIVSLLYRLVHGSLTGCLRLWFEFAQLSNQLSVAGVLRFLVAMIYSWVVNEARRQISAFYTLSSSSYSRPVDHTWFRYKEA